MIIIETAGTASTNPFFPLLCKAYRPVRVVTWARYKRTLIPFTIISLCLFCWSLAMTRADLYSDSRFDLLAFANLCFAFVRTMRFRKTTSVYVAPDLALRKISLLADLEFALCFGALGIAAFVVAVQNSTDYGGLFVLLGAFVFLFALIPTVNSVTLTVQKKFRL
jgi:hypothetical protein